MTSVTLYLLIIILNVDGSNFQIKKHRVTGQIEKKKKTNKIQLYAAHFESHFDLMKHVR